MRRAWIVAILFFISLACACPGTGGLQGTLGAMQSTIGAAMTEVPGMLTDLPATLEAQLATPEVEQTGTIRGHLSYPSEFLPAQRIVAFDAATMAFVADTTTVEGQGEYELTVPAGDYYIVAYILNGNLSAGYSQAVPCGLTVACTDHGLIPVHVGSGEVVEDIDPQDWYADPGNFPAMP